MPGEAEISGRRHMLLASGRPSYVVVFTQVLLWYPTHCSLRPIPAKQDLYLFGSRMSATFSLLAISRAAWKALKGGRVGDVDAVLLERVPEDVARLLVLLLSLLQYILKQLLGPGP